jgi:uncharacterized protein (DUF433 family)
MVKKGKNLHVVPRGGGWAVLGEGDKREKAHTLTQREAIERAREIAKSQGTEVAIHGSDGRIRSKIFYGDDITRTIEEYYLSDRIVISPAISHGKPRIKGTRIMVATILDLLASGKTVEEIISDDYYPDITHEDVLACIAYASQLANDSYAVENNPEISLKRFPSEYVFQ